uniref:Uncharacterized protein n=1 Tax=Anguilla anguilla TaxID=7936 RepID=A0A0E9T8Y2_ANGAN
MHCGSVGSDSECCPSEGPLAGLGCGPSWALILQSLICILTECLGFK